MTEFIITYLVMSMAAVGTGKLYMYLIQQGQLFKFMQPIIAECKHINDFLFRSIGGCEVCTIQRFNDLSYIILLSITDDIFFESHILISLFGYFILYIFYAGLSFFFYSLVSIQRSIEKPKIEKSTIHV